MTEKQKILMKYIDGLICLKEVQKNNILLLVDDVVKEVKESHNVYYDNTEPGLTKLPNYLVYQKKTLTPKNNICEAIDFAKICKGEISTIFKVNNSRGLFYNEYVDVHNCN